MKRHRIYGEHEKYGRYRKRRRCTRCRGKALFTWKRLKFCVFCLAVLAFAGLLAAFGISFYVKASVRGRLLSREDAAKMEDVDCILILGCLVRENGEMSVMLKDRMDEGIALYHAGAAGKILVSGDHGRTDYDEVNRMKAYAVENGVPAEDVFMDHAGFSTYESMYRARDIFGVKRMIVVTQKYHLYRAVYNARALGMDAWGVPADPRRYGGQLYRDLREVLAQDKDFLYCLIQPKPTYLGEAIPVQGNGNLTNDKEEKR